MNREFTPYDRALKLKELGFVDECMAYYTISLTEVEHKEDGTTGPFGWKKGEVFFEKRFFKNNSQGIDGSNENWLEAGAPLFQQAFRWFRDEHGVSIYVSPLEDGSAFYHMVYTNINVPFSNRICSLPSKWNTYEEAELACLDTLIELVERRKS
jgi:hypothetical protein